jgi:multisubunit Na+/H+ antiporter MnhB subunit
MTSAAILVRGYASTGDGFAAGVVASIGIVLQYVTFGRRRVELMLPVRYAARAAGVGLLIALAVVFVPTLMGKPILTHSPAPDAHVTYFGALELHTAILFDVGVFLVVVGAIVSMLHWIASPRKEPGS